MGKDAVKGIGGTRNCDWWFTDEAVLLDTAGRYTTQSSNREVDAAAWTGFLTLLKKFRPAQPLNGAIVTVSLSDLFTSSAAQRDDYARSIRARIQELYSTLGVRFPIYVIVTKTDLLAGFAEFFDDLGREARAQVWGNTFDFPMPAGANLGATFATEFDALVARLNARLTTRMEEERDPQRRATLFAFPQQFAALKRHAQGLPRRGLPQLRLRRGADGARRLLHQRHAGRQPVRPRAGQHLARLRARAPGAAAGGVVRPQLLPHAPAARRDLRGVRHQRAQRRHREAAQPHRAGAYSVLALLSLLLIVGWTISFVRNQVLIKDVADAAAEVAKQIAALPPLPTRRRDDRAAGARRRAQHAHRLRRARRRACRCRAPSA